MRIYLKSTLLLIFLNLFVSACNSPKSDFTKELAQKHMDKMIQAYIDGDAEGIVGAYADDGQMLEDGGPIVTGKDQIYKSTRALLENVKFLKGSSEVIEVYSERSLAYEISFFNLTARARNDTVVVENKWKHISIWKKQNNGEWKIARLIFNKRQ